MHTSGRLVCGEAGLPSRPCILFVHGGGTSNWIWRPQVEALASEFLCLTPDLPEHGGSRGLGPFTVADSVARLADLIRARASGARAHLVGLSLGGQLVLQMVHVAPDVVGRAVVSGASVRPTLGRSLIG